MVHARWKAKQISGSAFKAGFGYIVGLPVAAYLTWEGRLIEGKGVSPNIPVALEPEDLLASEDPQMQTRAFFRDRFVWVNWQGKRGKKMGNGDFPILSPFGFWGGKLGIPGDANLPL